MYTQRDLIHNIYNYLLKVRMQVKTKSSFLSQIYCYFFFKCCFLFFFKGTLLYIYLFLAALGLCCCVRAFFSCGERGLLFLEVRGLLIVVASCCGARALGAWASVVLECRLW